MDVCVRFAGDLPIVQKSFFRNFVAALVAFAVLKYKHMPLSWKKENLKYLLIRSAFGTAGILTTYYAIDNLVLSDASILTEMSLFSGILFSRIFLKEHCKPLQIAIVVVAFIGSMLVVKPTFANANLLGSLSGFLGGVLSGAAYTAVRACGIHGEPKEIIILFFSAFSCIVLLPIMLFSYVPMTPLQVLMLLSAGVAAGGAQLAITAAYTYAPAKSIAVYHFTHVMFAAMLGLIFFNMMPDYLSVIGYIVICAMSVAMFFYNQREEQEESALQGK